MKQPESMNSIQDFHPKAPSSEETEIVLPVIKENTLLIKGYPAVPEQTDSNFTLLPDTEIQDGKELSNRTVDIFVSGSGEPPKNIYVLTQEEVENIDGLTKFDFKTFAEQVVPYIYEKGAANYWATDAKTATVTFHQSGNVYWKKMPKKD